MQLQPGFHFWFLAWLARFGGFPGFPFKPPGGLFSDLRKWPGSLRRAEIAAEAQDSIEQKLSAAGVPEDSFKTGPDELFFPLGVAWSVDRSPGRSGELVLPGFFESNAKSPSPTRPPGIYILWTDLRVVS